MGRDKTLEQPCPFCGGGAYTWGVVYASGIRFVPDAASAWNRFFWVRQRPTARRCDGCGNIQLFAEGSKPMKSNVDPEF